MEDEPIIQADNSALDCNGITLKPNDLVAEVNSTQCDNLAASSGLDGQQKSNCDDLSDMVCAIKQDVDAIATQKAMVIAPNDASKCQNDTDPTLASFWSRVLRFSEAVSCILCQYDPFVATILKSGRYPQILMGAVQTGADGTGYPQWVNPDSVPTEGSSKPVTSQGIVTAVSEAIMSVWHLWEEYPEFDYFAQTLDDEDNVQNLLNQTSGSVPDVGTTALVSFDGTHHNALYTYRATGWEFTKEFGADDGLTNFAVTHINSGYYADKGVYYFHDGTNDTWQVMDVELGDVEDRLEELEKIYENAVTSGNEGVDYILATAPTLADANSVACTEGKQTIVLITG